MSEPVTSAQLLQQGLFHHRQGDLKLAMDRYTEALRIDPDNADALYYVAVVCCQQGEFKQGAELARRAIARGSTQARVHNLLGRALDALGEPLEAIKSFDQAIAIDANFAEAHSNRANILIKAELPEQALKASTVRWRSIRNRPSDWINRGALLQDLGRHAEALESYDKAIMARPISPKPTSIAPMRSRISGIWTPRAACSTRRASRRPTPPTARPSPSSRASKKPISGADCFACCAATGRPAFPTTSIAKKSASRHLLRSISRAGTARSSPASGWCC